MNPRPDGAAAAFDSAHLLIHTGNAVGTIRSLLDLVFRALGLKHSPWQDREPIQVDVEDLGGNKMLSLDEAAPLIDLPLPPGTYQVTARHGKVRRGYTLTLARNTSFDLYLSPDGTPK
jgi:hypothetical protein